MGSMLNALMGEGNMQINDSVIANDTLIGLKGAAAGYLLATLESATPEIRRMWSDYLTQTVLAHEGVTALAVKKGWYQPYLGPEEQITQAYKKSQELLTPQA